MNRGAANTQVTLKGKGIDGSIEIPNDSTRPVLGRFARLHVSTAGPTDDAKSASRAVRKIRTSTTTAESVEVDDPAALPPLRFSIADLRLGQAQLGKAELADLADGQRNADREIPDPGEESRHRRRRRLDQHRRRRNALESPPGFTADSLGQMLDALGYKDMVEGGKTQATLTGTWPGLARRIPAGDLAAAR